MRRLVPALIALELLACLGDLLLGPFGRVHWEERFNARAGVQLACGHWDALTDLQYVSFCGGCTGEALLAVPIFGVLGPTVLAWKLVPLAFHAVVLAAGGWLATRASGPRGGAAFVALLAAAPGFYRELVLTGWGNHVESAAFPFAAAACLVGAAGRGRTARLLGVVVAGALAGLGAWFCHTSTYALPALALGAAWVAPWALPAFLGAAWLGFQPYHLYLDAEPDQAERTVSWALTLHPAPASRLVDWLWGPYLRWGLWDPADHGEGSSLRGAWWFGFWGVGLAGMLGAVRRGAGDPRLRGRLARGFAPLCLLALIAAYALRFDLWAHLPEVASQPTLGLRYRAPLVPLLALGAALLVGRRRGAVWLLAPLLAFGLWRRAALWTDVHTELPGLGVYAHDGWRDRSVPLGQPAQRLVRKQGRPQDLDAGLSFAEAHDDPLPECGWDHGFEIGRRLGLGLAERGPGEVGLDWSRLDPMTEDAIAARLLADGVASVLVEPEAQGLDAAVHTARALPDPWSGEVGAALGRRVAMHVAHHADDAVVAGICGERAERWTRGEPVTLGGVALAPAEDPCVVQPAWAFGVGRGAAAAEGCGASEAARLTEIFEEEDARAAALEGLRQGCRQLRVR